MHTKMSNYMAAAEIVLGQKPSGLMSLTTPSGCITSVTGRR